MVSYIQKDKIQSSYFKTVANGLCNIRYFILIFWADMFVVGQRKGGRHFPMEHLIL